MGARIENVVFDMGNVLVLYDARRFVNAHIEHEDDRQLVLAELFASVEWVMLDRGSITPEQAAAAVCARLPARLHDVVCLLLETWHQDLPPFPEMEALAARLKANGHGVYLLSNAGKSFHRFRQNIPALRHFDGEFISADCGLLKPDAAIYEAFLLRFGLRPERCFFIDDAPANVEGALRAGMQGFVFRQNVPVLEGALRAAGVRV